MDLTFGIATTADAASLVDLIESAYRGDSSRAGWTTEADLLDGHRTDVDDVVATLSADDSLVLTASDGGRLIGCCNIKRVDDVTSYLGMFAVDPQQQGRGIGRRVISEAERRAQLEWSSTRMVMGVIKQRAELIAWYERLGYRRTGEFQPFPYDQTRFGIPKRDDLEFAQLAKDLDSR